MILDVSTYIVHIQIINGGKGKPNIVVVVRNENKKYPLICFHRKDLSHLKNVKCQDPWSKKGRR